MEKPHIVIIDDGINEDEINYKLKHNLFVDKDMKVKEKSGFNKSFHGTVCLKIIIKYLKKDVPISSIKILNEKGISDMDKLLAALKKAEEIGADLINLSLGSTTFKDKEKLLPAINSVASKGIITVCAVNNSLYYTYPGAFTNVISVCADRDNILKEDEFEILDTNFPNIFIKAFARHFIKFNDEIKRKLYPANSYAAPMITAIIANNYNAWSKKRKLYVEDIKRCLNDISINKKENIFKYPHTDWLQNALYVSIGKESANSFDLRYLGNKVRVSEYTFETENDFIEFIKDYVKMDTVDTDTLIIKTIITLSEIKIKNIQETIKGKIYSIIFLDGCNVKYNLQVVKDGFRVWSAIDILKYASFNKKEQNLKEISVPLIVINLEDTSKFLSNDIKTFFENKDYKCQIFSDDIYKLLSDAEYINTSTKEMYFDDLIFKTNEIIDTGKTDLAIMEFDNKAYFERFGKIADIVIKINKNKLNIKYEQTEEEFLIADGKIDTAKLLQTLNVVLN